jgi:hypothetical protein
VKQALKDPGDAERAFVIACLCKFFRGDGTMWSPQAGPKHKTIVLDGDGFWLVRVPKKRRKEGAR